MAAAAAMVGGGALAGSIYYAGPSQRKMLPLQQQAFFGSRSIRSSSGKRRSLRGHVVRALAGGESSSSAVAPVKLESPVGQFLVALLQSHPHLFSAAAEQQIQKLAADKEAATSVKPSGVELVLYERIAEVKERERQTAIVELMYALVLQRFMEMGVRLIPKISNSGVPEHRVDSGWTCNRKELESIHSPEVLEVIEGNLGMTIPVLSQLDEERNLVQASKMVIGHMYAASVVFGYFLKRLEQRYRLDQGMKMLTEERSGKREDLQQQQQQQKQTRQQMEGSKFITGVSTEMDFTADSEGRNLAQELNAAAAALKRSASSRFPSSKLGEYLATLDPEVVQGLANLRTKESLEVVERQTQALFGKPEVEVTPEGRMITKNSSDDSIRISFAGFRRLVLEAVAFGTFLLEAESYVDSSYTLL